MRILTTLNDVDQSAHVLVDAGDGLHVCLDDRLIGARFDDRTFSLVLTGPNVPHDLIGVRVRGTMGSEVIDEHFEPEPGLVFTHEWNGEGGPAGRPCTGEFQIGWELAGRFPRPERTKWWSRTVVGGRVDLRPLGCGGFTPNGVPRLDLDGDVLWRPDGTKIDRATTRTSAALANLTIGSNERAVVDGTLVHIFDLEGHFEGTLETRRDQVVATAEHDAWGRLVTYSHQGHEYNVEHEHDDGSPGTEVLVESPSEVWLAMELDDEGRAITLVDHDRHTTRLRYDRTGALIRIEDPRQLVTEIDRDELGRVSGLRDSSGRAVSLVHHGDGHVSTTTGVGRRFTRLVSQHDDGSTSVRETSANGLERSIETTGPRRTVTWRNGMSVTTEQTTRGGGSSIVEVAHELIEAPSGRSLRQVRESARTGERVTIGAHTWTVEHDSATKTTTRTTPKGLLTTSTLDARKDLDVVLPSGMELRVEFDKQRRPKRRWYGDVEVRSGYDQYGRLAWTEIDRMRQQVQHDAQGRVIGVKTPDGWMRFERDAAGWITALRTVPGETTTIERGANGRIETLSYPERTDGGRRVESFRRDPDGFLIAHQFGPDEDETSTVIDYERDDLGRIASIASDDLKILSEFHPSTGQLTALSSQTGDAVNWTWDGDMCWAEETTGTSPARIERVFDEDLVVAVRSVNRAFALTYERNEDGRLSAVGPLKLERNRATGNCIGMHLGGLSTMRDYDDRGQLIRHETRLGMMAKVIFAEELGRDEFGRITSVFETVNGRTRSIEYRYDERDRLSTVLVNGEVSVSLRHDGNDNVIELTRGEFGVALEADSDDRLASIAGEAVRYDAAGNLVGLGPDGAFRTYRFDGLNQLVGSTDARGRTTNFTLDPLGRPIRITHAGEGETPQTAARFVWDGDRIVATLAGDDNLDMRFIDTRTDVGPEAVVRGGLEYRLLRDHLGSVRMVVNTQTGEAVQELVFDALGRVVSDTAPGWQPFGWAGGLQDATSGVVRFGRRVYDPFIGRFISPAPDGFASGTTNVYQCADGDPINNGLGDRRPIDPKLAPSSPTGELSVLDDPFVLSRPMSVDRVWLHGERWRSGVATVPSDDQVSHVRATWSLERDPIDTEFDESWHPLTACAGRGGYTYVPTDVEVPSRRERVKEAVKNRPTVSSLAPQVTRELTAVVDSLQD